MEGAQADYFGKLIETLGIADQINAKAVTIPAGFTAEKVISGEAEMAVQQIHQLLDQADARWPVIRSAVVHRVGHLELGDIAVAVAVSTPHRKDAFEAGQWVMDRIKEVVPIWKKEHWADGSTEWVHPDSGRPGATDDGAAG